MIQQTVQRELKPISIERLLEWTFSTEKAQLEPPAGGQVVIPRYLGFNSMQNAMNMMAALGRRIDTSPAGATFLGSDRCHWDAEAVAAVVAGVLDRRIAIMVAEHARAGTRPTWMAGAVPMVVPAVDVENQHGRQAKTEDAGPSAWSGGVWRKWMTEARKSRKAAARAPVPLTKFETMEETRKHLGRVCPIVFEPTRQQIDTARVNYVAWWEGVHKVREALIAGQVLRSHTITREMPPAMPWIASGEGPTIVETGTKHDWRGGDA